MHEATQSFISLLIIYLTNGNIRCPTIICSELFCLFVYVSSEICFARQDTLLCHDFMYASYPNC